MFSSRRRTDVGKEKYRPVLVIKRSEEYRTREVTLRIVMRYERHVTSCDTQPPRRDHSLLDSRHILRLICDFEAQRIVYPLRGLLRCIIIHLNSRARPASPWAAGCLRMHGTTTLSPFDSETCSSLLEPIIAARGSFHQGPET